MRHKMTPGVTLVAFILGYIDVLTRFATWGIGGARHIPVIALLTLFFVVAANNKKNWARVCWTVWTGFGIICSFGLCFEVDNSFVVFISIVLSSMLLICLWHPKTNEWFLSS